MDKAEGLKIVQDAVSAIEAAIKQKEGQFNVQMEVTIDKKAKNCSIIRVYYFIDNKLCLCVHGLFIVYDIES